MSKFGVGYSDGGGGSPGPGTGGTQRFTATAGQTTFAVTSFTLGTTATVFSGTNLCDPTEYSISVGNIIFNIGRLAGTLITVTQP